MDWHIRAFRQEDIPALAALFDAADRADRLHKLVSEESLRAEFGAIGPNSQTKVIVADGPSQPGAPQGVLLGIGRLSSLFDSATRERIYNLMLRVHPSARKQGLQHAIARRLVEMARAAEASPVEHADKVRLATYVFDSQGSSIEAWQGLGLRRVRTGWTMMRSLEGPIQVEPAPNGIALRTYRYPDDNPQALQASSSALSDYYDFHLLSESSWDRVVGASYSRPDLSWLAFSEADSGGAVGVAICWVDANDNKQIGRLEGWIEGMGVVPGFRRRGIGKALLTRALQSLQSAGLETALADVDSESRAAVGLFRSAGFRERNALLQYECLLEEVKLTAQ